uniref:NIDO domain-containing protein n=1 Tax=Plectus sambesii TaxID=2011161 RepID=A0A914VIY8_9BILA
MAPWGLDAGDEKVMPEMNDYGQAVDLHMNFPFYGGSYNQTQVSINGFVSFATILDQGPTINVGIENTDWPRVADPAMIAPYLCKQQIAQGPHGHGSGVYYRIAMRQSLFASATSNPRSAGTRFFNQSAEKACAGTNSYVRCDASSDLFLDQMMRWLQDGVAGASVFKADAALIVTWYNTASAMVGRSDMEPENLSTYQMIWLTNREGSLSYVLINYDKLGFEAADLGTSTKSGRCQALFNGGNHTGSVMVDVTEQFKASPKILARRSSVPHVVRGRYMFRVDDVVRPAGCSNKTGGTFPLLIYPDIVNMLGEMTVDVNGLCMNSEQTYILMIEQRPSAPCTRINAAIARCYLPKVYDWGTKTVFFQPQSSGINEEKAYVGFIYFVPPTLDPMRLDIGNLHDWFKNPIPSPWMPIMWYPRNFTDPDFDYRNGRIGEDAMYNVQLGLFVMGYKESKDASINKYRPIHKTIARLATFANKNTVEYRWKAQEERITLNQVEHWFLSADERRTDLFTYRMGY